MKSIAPTLPHKIAVLVFIQDSSRRQLLLQRLRPPNQGFWSPIGGKLDVGSGESPFECAIRETREETGLTIATHDLHLFAMIAERSYENTSHWLLFLFNCTLCVPAIPPVIDEGSFGLFSRSEIETLSLPETDKTILWPLYDQHRHHFVALRAQCSPGRPPEVIVEQIVTPTDPGSPT